MLTPMVTSRLVLLSGPSFPDACVNNLLFASGQTWIALTSEHAVLQAEQAWENLIFLTLFLYLTTFLSTWAFISYLAISLMILMEPSVTLVPLPP